jgi:hypothetical protein
LPGAAQLGRFGRWAQTAGEQGDANVAAAIAKMILPGAAGRLSEVWCTPPVAVIAFNRPHYLGQFLASLAAQQPRVEPRRIHLFLDGAVNHYSGIRRAEDAEIAASLAVFREHFPRGHVHASTHNIGIAENILRAERLFFEELRTPVGYFFEDDLVLSPHYVAALDLMRRAFARFDRIVYFNANGDHRASLEQQRNNARKLMFMGGLTAFALKRSHWLRLQTFLGDYYRLVIGCDYRMLPRAELKALFRSWGKSQTHPHVSQDAAKDFATHLMGRWRATCYPAFCRYIGAWGVHYTPARYEELGFNETVLHPEPLTALDLRREEIERQIDDHLVARTRDLSKVFADQTAAFAQDRGGNA